MVRVDALWLATKPPDMRAGTETTLARVVSDSGAARPHHAYLFANRKGYRMRCWCTRAPGCGWQHGA
ncbi:MAG: hypothetical protein EON54_01710 [Alcaligenaceae bacterium]|nr:MAG: hypothetical protein EON54_01710 [Alcaligenaceae bacterium]